MMSFDFSEVDTYYCQSGEWVNKQNKNTKYKFFSKGISRSKLDKINNFITNTLEEKANGKH